MVDSRILSKIREVVQMLLAGDFDGIERLTGGIRLSAKDMRTAVQNYGRTLILPPEGMEKGLSIEEIENAVPRAWAVDCDLWTKEEGRSDLTLQLTLIANDAELRVEVDGLHVL